MKHVPVMPDEVTELLEVREGGVYVDCTLGYGGHAARVMEKAGESGMLIGIEWDGDALSRAKEALAGYAGRARFFQRSYTELPGILDEAGTGPADGIMLDLGASSPQLTTPGRGFSFREEGPLDMRMDAGRELTAGRVVNTFPAEELETIFREYGEERFARRIASAIVARRRSCPIKTTVELARLARSVSGRSPRGIHPATRIFQALRIYVNTELENIKSIMDSFPAFLKPGGRITVISFHSLEDRIIKRSFKRLSDEGVLKPVTKAPVTASGEEIRRNPNSRSAKLRAAEKT